MYTWAFERQVSTYGVNLTDRVLIVIPAALGTIVGGLYASCSEREGWGWIRNRLTAEREDAVLQVILGPTPAPRAWDDLFSERLTAQLRIKTIDGTAVAGVFADQSYAEGFPHDADLYLEQAWSVGEALGYVYIPAGQIARIEIFAPDEQE